MKSTVSLKDQTSLQSFMHDSQMMYLTYTKRVTTQDSILKLTAEKTSSLFLAHHFIV